MSKLKKSLRQYDKSKQNKETLISGELGITLGGSRVVEISGRKGFVYVRLKGNTSELIQAYNASVPPIYDLPVLVVRQGGIYRVIGRNIERHTNQWGSEAYLPKHGGQHSFNHNANTGGDVVWVYSQQFMPLLSYPSGSAGGMTLAIEPHFYEWNGMWKYAQNTGTPDYTPYLPTTSGSARMVLSYIDPSDNSIKLVPGTPFPGDITGSAQVAQYIPDIPRSIGVPLAAVRLASGTTSLMWDAIYDVRDFYTVGNTITGSIASVDTIGFAGMDSGVPLGTGTVLNVTGDGATFTRSGTVFNLDIVGGGGGGGAGIMGWDEGVPLVTGTVLNVTGDGATLTASGTVLNLYVPGGGGVNGVGVMAWDEGVPLGTGTVFDFVGSSVEASISGSVIQVNVSGGTELIQEISLVGNPTGTFSNIPQGYRHLKLMFALRSTAAVTDTELSIYFNQDYTITNYRRTVMFAYGGGTVAAVASQEPVIGSVINGASSPTGSYSMAEVTFPYYSKTHFNKEFVAIGTHRRDVSSVYVLTYTASVEWFAQQSAINRIDFVLDSGNFITGSFATLYGTY